MKRSALVLACLVLGSCGKGEMGNESPIAWGEVVDGLQLGVRPDLENSSPTVLPTWTIFLRNVSSRPIVVSNPHSDLLAGVHEEAWKDERRGGDSFRSCRSFFTSSRPGEYALEPGQILSGSFSTQTFFTSYQIVSEIWVRVDYVSDRDRDREGVWSGQMESGPITLRRTTTGWSWVGASREDWADREQLLREFEPRLPDLIRNLDGPMKATVVRLLQKLGPRAWDARRALEMLLEQEQNEAMRREIEDAMESLASR